MTPEVHSLIGAYVLDAVDDLERVSFDRHLRECEVCRAEVDELREASAQLAGGAWSAPPPRLRDDVMSAIATTRQIAPISPAAPVRAPRRSRLRLVSAAAAVVVAAAGAAAGATVYAVQDQRVRDQRAVAERAQAGEARVRAVLAAPDLVVKEQPLSGGGKVTVAVSRQQDAGVVMLAAGTAPVGDQVYQLWTIRDQQPESEGALAVGQAAAVQIVNGISQASDVAVTVERAPGAKTPTLPTKADVQL